MELLPLSVLSLFLVLTSASPFNITLSDQSPAISYSPSRSGEATSTWNVTYSSTPWATYAEQTIGLGTSVHYTTAVGALASLSWEGTAVYVWGSSGAGVVNMTVDGVYKSGSGIRDGLLGWATGLSAGWHTVEVRVLKDSGVNITGVTITTDLGAKGDVLQYHPPSGMGWKQYQLRSGYFSRAMGGERPSWRRRYNVPVSTSIHDSPRPELGNSTQVTYARVDTNTPSSQLSLIAPADTSFVLLYGSVNFDHGPFLVTLSSSSTSSSTPSQVLNQSFTADSPWTSLDQVTYFAKLDPSVQWEVTIESTGNSSQYWDIASAVFVKASAKSRNVDESEPFEVDEYVEYPTTPYYDNVRPADEALPSMPSLFLKRNHTYMTATDPHELSPAIPTPLLLHSPSQTSDTYRYSQISDTHSPPQSGSYLRQTHSRNPSDETKSSMRDSSIASPSPGLRPLSGQSQPKPSRPHTRPTSGQTYRQEEDAGRVDVVPPTYNPDWIRESVVEDE
ncbi:hypothetical protein P7C73_g192, partial [Tremellales sp. Uapishka_1]